MSTIIDRINSINQGVQDVKADFKTALENKGVEVADDLKLKEYPPLLENIQVGGGGDGYYKCISVDIVNETWQGLNMATGETEELEYTVEPGVGYVYNSTGITYVGEIDRTLGYDLYRRRVTGDMGGYNLDFVDEVNGSDTYSNYAFRKVPNKRFIDYCVLSGSYAVAIGYDGNIYSMGSYSWGDCISGQGGALSNPNPNKTTYKLRLADGSGNWEKLFCVYNCTWALNSDKELYRCGSGDDGRLGFGDTRAYWKLTKLEISGVYAWKKVALYEGSNRAFVLSEDGRLFATGKGDNGELGVADPLDPTKISWSGYYGSYPYPIVTLSADGSKLTVSGAGSTEVNGTYTKTENSSYQRYYVKDDDSQSYVYASNYNPPSWGIAHYNSDWGYATDYYSGSASTSTTSFIEIVADTPCRWKDVFCGYNNAGAISDDGRLFVWGSNSYGQLAQGEGNTGNVYRPKQIGTNKLSWRSADFGQYHLVAIASDGTLWAAGRGIHGQLGLGSSNTSTQYSLVQVGRKTDWKHVMCRDNITMLVGGETNKVYYCGGSATLGGFGTGAEYMPTYHGYELKNYQKLDFERFLTNECVWADWYYIRYCRGLSDVTIPLGTKHISDVAFIDNGYSLYSNIYIPKSVISIASNAFSSFYGTKIIFEAEQSEIPSGYPWGHMGGDGYFTYGASFEPAPYNSHISALIEDNFDNFQGVLEIPEGVTSIYYKFQNYQSVKVVKLPDTIQALESAFRGCINLRTVYIDNVEDSYWYSPFSNCPNLTKIYCNWTWGTKPNVESYAPWGATNATIYDDTGAKVYPK